MRAAPPRSPRQCPWPSPRQHAAPSPPAATKQCPAATAHPPDPAHTAASLIPPFPVPPPPEVTPMRADAPSTLRAVIDGEALIANVSAIQERIGDRTLMAIVKGDAYGHGVDLVVPALLTAGVRRLGVATAAEALRVHDLLTALPGGADTTLLFWIHDRTTDLTPAIARGIEVG